MRKVVKLIPWVAVLVALAFLSGCATVCGVEETPAVKPPPPPKKWEGVPAPVTEKPAPPPALPTTYTVEKCDDLWSISAKPQIYNDPWLWPLLVKANNIANPNKIKPGMVLKIPRDMSDADKAAARGKANKFPKYYPPKGAKRYCPPK